MRSEQKEEIDVIKSKLWQLREKLMTMYKGIVIVSILNEIHRLEERLKELTSDTEERN